ncbi:MAG: flagellar assembly protein FliX [Rickettsiales bacterium]|nr:flagellar assembly protein FliX [Rickettsiales bacterium]
MIKIDSIGTTQTQRTNAKKRKSKTENSAFSGMLSSIDHADEAKSTSSVQQTNAVNNVNMLSLQEISDDDMQERKALKHGHSTLDALEEIRNGLLIGSLSGKTIEQLDTFVRKERERATSPELEAILDEIEVRAAVEMAKLERAKNRD